MKRLFMNMHIGKKFGFLSWEIPLIWILTQFISIEANCNSTNTMEIVEAILFSKLIFRSLMKMKCFDIPKSKYFLLAYWINN